MHKSFMWEALVGPCPPLDLPLLLLLLPRLSETATAIQTASMALATRSHWCGADLAGADFAEVVRIWSGTVRKWRVPIVVESH